VYVTFVIDVFFRMIVGWRALLQITADFTLDALEQASWGSVGDPYNNSLAESINGLYKTEVIRKRGPWKRLEKVEYATLEWVHWFNHKRLLEPIGNIPPAEYEEGYYTGQVSSTLAVGLP
jgi:transposase InsO family protein